jgi:hypothetical protein
MSNAQSPVAAAVEPFRAAAVARAMERAREIAEILLARFATHPENFAVPKLTFTNKREHAIASSNRATLYAITAPDDSSGRRKRVRSETGIERFVVEAGENAGAQYTAFILKLELKVGKCDAATLEGDHVWGHSTLTVTKGEQSETWITHQIINVSKLGKVFNQWPSRKVKR